MKCEFKYGDGSQCPNEIPTGPYCDHHATMPCVSCHQQATHSCPNVGKNQGICGCALCDSCEHVDMGNINGQLWQHAPRGEEMKVPHYAKDVAGKK